MTRRAGWVLVVALLAGACLWYLREPSWLDAVDSGFRGWETSADGQRYRWTGGHASFSVPRPQRPVVLTARPTCAPGDRPVRVSIAIDGRTADALVLTDDRWQVRQLRLPPPGSRRLRRIDIRVDRPRAGNRGAQIGEVTVMR